MISFVHLYKKTERNLRRIAEESQNAWWDPSISQKQDFAAELFRIAEQRRMDLTICSQPELVTVQHAARCIDAARLADVAGKPFSAKTLGNRPGCECAESRDIGDYDTCPHGCVYCYAVRSPDLAIKHFQTHDPASPFLFSDPTDPVEIPIQTEGQLRLIE